MLPKLAAASLCSTVTSVASHPEGTTSGRPIVRSARQASYSLQTQRRASAAVCVSILVSS